MLLTSQNRNSVFQVQVAKIRGQVLAAAVAHREDASKRPYSGMRRTRHPATMALGTKGALMPASMSRECLAVDSPTSFTTAGESGLGPNSLNLQPRLWASLVLSPIGRG